MPFVHRLARAVSSDALPFAGRMYFALPQDLKWPSRSSLRPTFNVAPPRISILHVVVPAGIPGDPVIRKHQRAPLRGREVREDDHRGFLQPKLSYRLNPSV